MEGETELKPHLRFEVEKIIGVSSEGNYQVQWAPAWVSKFHLIGCEHLIQEFLQQQKEEEVKHGTGHQLEEPDITARNNARKHHTVGFSEQQVEEDESNLEYDISLENENYIKDMTTDVEGNPAKSTCEMDANKSNNQALLQSSLFSVEVKQEDCNWEMDWQMPVLRNISVSNDELEEECEHSTSETFLKETPINDLVTLQNKEFQPAERLDNNEFSNEAYTTFSKRLSHPNELRKCHSPTHARERPYKCSYCTKSFVQKNHLVTHIRFHKGDRPWSCEWCHFSFVQKQDLQRHMRTHTGEKPYTCDVCEKSFSTKGGLNSHTRIHAREEQYSCDPCGKTFLDKDSCNEHMRHCPLNTTK